MHFREGDTIIAHATPAGRGALAVVRISGPATGNILGKLLSNGVPEPRKAVFDRAVSGDEVIDQVVAVLYRAPASYTGEDAAEITCHGGPAVVARLIEEGVKAGARPAEPGEFTWRALLAGKLDLVQAEAVADITAAETETARLDAASRLEGKLSEKFRAIRELVLETATAVEADINFDIGIERREVLDLLARAAELARELAATSLSRRLAREGVTVAILGPPNAGKSTLFNRLLGEDRAIVTPIPGTTTDRIEATALLGGIPFRLNDSCGLSETPADEIEAEGERRSREFAAAADIAIWVTDATTTDIQNPPDLGENPEIIWVHNKIDLPGASVPPGALAVSALTGENVPELIETMSARAPDVTAGSTASLAERERSALLDAAAHLEEARQRIATGEFLDIAAEDIRAALRAVGSLLGDITTDEVLASIFAKFCIGK